MLATGDEGKSDEGGQSERAFQPRTGAPSRQGVTPLAHTSRFVVGSKLPAGSSSIWSPIAREPAAKNNFSGIIRTAEASDKESDCP